eukprot:5055041-Amphidinium_carterae.1
MAMQRRDINHHFKALRSPVGLCIRALSIHTHFHNLTITGTPNFDCADCYFFGMAVIRTQQHFEQVFCKLLDHTLLSWSVAEQSHVYATRTFSSVAYPKQFDNRSSVDFCDLLGFVTSVHY